MTTNEVVSAYLSLTPQQQIRILAQVAHNLTISARAAYPGQVEEPVTLKKLPVLNELQHTIIGQLMNLAAENSNRYPDDVFLRILVDKARSGQCEADLAWAFLRAFPAQEESARRGSIPTSTT